MNRPMHCYHTRCNSDKFFGASNKLTKKQNAKIYAEFWLSLRIISSETYEEKKLYHCSLQCNLLKLPNDKVAKYTLFDIVMLIST